jgi:hypothetical protein
MGKREHLSLSPHSFEEALSELAAKAVILKNVVSKLHQFM